MTGMERLNSQDGKWRVMTGEGDILARAVIVATGSSQKKLDVPGEQRLTGNGVSQCASCDAPLLRDRIVAVVGGGESGNAGGLDARRIRFEGYHPPSRERIDGPSLLHRDRMTAHRKIDIRFDTAVTEILGEAESDGLAHAQIA